MNKPTLHLKNITTKKKMWNSIPRHGYYRFHVSPMTLGINPQLPLIIPSLLQLPLRCKLLYKII